LTSERPDNFSAMTAKDLVPDPVKALVTRGVKAYAVRTSSLRVLPDYLIIGAQRSGTTSLYRYLVQHPWVAPTVMGKGVHYFDVDFARGPAWYRGHFPTKARRGAAHRRGIDMITGEGSPYYLFHPLVPKRVAALLPEVKLIAMVRDPVGRALSHYQHFVRRGIEVLPTFEAALEAEPGRLAGEVDRLRADPGYRAWDLQHFSYVARGMYADQLERWSEHVPPERLLVLRSEDFFVDPADAFTKVEAFLGLPHHPPRAFERHNAESYRGMEPSTRQMLAERFAEPNERLAAFLGMDLRWDG
jgi:hypothetical protein